MTKIRVRALPGRLVPDASGMPGRWIGWEPCSKEQAQHTIPAGPSSVYLRRVDAVEVAESASVRRAIARGDLEVVRDVEAKSAGKRATTPSEG